MDSPSTGLTDLEAQSDHETDTPPKPELNMVEMAVSFVSPALFGKICILLFGSLYSAHPGKGYGIALLASISFTVVMLMRFAWRYRHYSED